MACELTSASRALTVWGGAESARLIKLRHVGVDRDDPVWRRLQRPAPTIAGVANAAA